MEYYPIYLNIRNKRCLVVGGGNVALRKIDGLLKAGAKVDVVAPDCDKIIIDYAEKGIINIFLREFIDSDIDGANLVIGATDYSEVNNRIYELASQNNIPVNIVDCPDLCTFIVPSIIDKGKLLISISTQGTSPAFARKIREELEMQFGDEYNIFLKIMEEIRLLLPHGIRNQKERQAFYEALTDSELLTLCKNKDSAKITELITQLFQRFNITNLDTKIFTIVNQIFSE
jgi:precorrin-2 dehydrogenase / sirohydrochlorin ferrochelatase